MVGSIDYNSIFGLPLRSFIHVANTQMRPLALHVQAGDNYPNHFANIALIAKNTKQNKQNITFGTNKMSPKTLFATKNHALFYKNTL